MTDKQFDLTRRKILGSLGAVGLAGAGAGFGTSALFSDEESFDGNTITAGTLDMSVTAEVVAANQYWEDEGIIGGAETADGEPVVGVEAKDVKPGDWAIIGFTIDVQDNPGCVTITTENLTSYENGRTEPEKDVDSTGGGTLGSPLDGEGNGELQEHLVAEVWEDFDGSVSSENPEDYLMNRDPTTPAGTTLVDADNTYSTGVTVGGGTAFNTSQFYLLLELPADVGNQVQSDSVEWDLRFEAIQARNNSDCNLTGDGADCECPEPSFTPGSTDDDFSNLLSVGPDPDSGFPDIDARLRIDTPAGNGGDLTASNFAINEDGCGQTIEDVAFESGGAVDIVVVFDDTASMGGAIEDLKTEVSNFTSNLEAEGVDARYALVSFKDNAEVDTDLTTASNFQSAVSGLSASGGDDRSEDNVDALAVGTGNAQAQVTDNEDPATGGELSAFRPGAQRVLIDITDVGAHDETDTRTRFSQADVEGFLNDGNFAYYAVAPDRETADVNKRDIADNVDDGTWIEFSSSADLTPVIDDITADITDEAYVISYTSACSEADGTERTVDVEIDDPDEGMLYEQGSYPEPSS